MSAFVLVPCLFWEPPYSAITVNGITSDKIFRAMNSPKQDFMDVGLTDYVDFKTLTDPLPMPSSIVAANSAIYLKVNEEVVTDTNPDYWAVNLESGPDTVSLTTAVLTTVYGNADDKGSLVSFHDGISDFPEDSYARAIGIYDDQLTDPVFRVTFDSAGTPVADFNLYEIMVGHVIALPDGFVRRERSYQRVHYGGKVGTSRFGHPIWSGVYSAKPRESFDLVMQGLRPEEQNIWRDTFRYGRGVYPVIVVEDSKDVTTWRKCKMINLSQTENSGEFDVTISFEEV